MGGRVSGFVNRLNWNRYDGISTFNGESEYLHFGFVPAAGQGRQDVLQQLAGMEAESGLCVWKSAFEEESGDEAGHRIPEPASPRYVGLVEVACANDEVGFLGCKGLVEARDLVGVVLAVGIDDDGALDLRVFEGGLEPVYHGGSFSLVAGKPDEADGEVDVFEAAVAAAIVDDDDAVDHFEDILDDGADVRPGVVAWDDDDGVGAQGLIFGGAVHETWVGRSGAFIWSACLAFALASATSFATRPAWVMISEVSAAASWLSPWLSRSMSTVA